MAETKNLVIEQGKTFTLEVRCSKPPIIYKPITAITQAAPVRITSASHGIPAGWKVAIVSVKGMTQINAENSPPKAKDYHTATVIDVNTIELNDVNSADYKAYVSGGYIQFDTPADLAGHNARMSIKDKVGGTELFRLDTTLVAPQPRIVIDDVAKKITLSIAASDTAGLAWKKGVYDLELVSPSGVVTALLTGSVSVSQEVTTA